MFPKKYFICTSAQYNRTKFSKPVCFLADNEDISSIHKQEFENTLQILLFFPDSRKEETRPQKELFVKVTSQTELILECI